MAMVIAGRNAPVLARRPERLLVEGCRAFLNGFSTRCIDCWEVGWSLYAAELGPRDARRLMGDLAHFVREAHCGADRPLACLPYGCQRLSRDECLLMAAVAAQQNADPAVAVLAAAHLAPTAAGSLAAAAEAFGEALQGVSQQLLPVPARVVEDVATRPPSACFH